MPRSFLKNNPPYTKKDFTRSGGHYDIVFDTVAMRSFKECKPVLTPKGIYITTLPSVGTVLRMLIGPVVGRPRARVFSVQIRGADLETLGKWIEAEKVRPMIDRVFSLSETTEAHRSGEIGTLAGEAGDSGDRVGPKRPSEVGGPWDPATGKPNQGCGMYRPITWSANCGISLYSSERLRIFWVTSPLFSSGTCNIVSKEDK